MGSYTISFSNQTGGGSVEARSTISLADAAYSATRGTTNSYSGSYYYSDIKSGTTATWEEQLQRFDISSIPAGEVATSVTLREYGVTGGISSGPTAGSVFETFIYDYGGSADTTDFRNPDDLQTLYTNSKRVAYYDTSVSSWHTVAYPGNSSTYNDFTNDGTHMLDYINSLIGTASFANFIITPQSFRNKVYTNFGCVGFATYLAGDSSGTNAKLYITTTAGGGGATLGGSMALMGMGS